MSKRIATCVCGQLKVACTGDPSLVSLCHCSDCQKRTGSAFGIAAFFQKRDVEVAGKAQRYTRSSDSGFRVTFHFCPTCGSCVYWEPTRKPDAIAVAYGAFADPTFPSPTQEVYTQHRHPWVKFST